MLCNNTRGDEMAKLIRTAMEENPDNDAGVVLFAYFEGTPSEEELDAIVTEKVADDMQEWAEPERQDNEVSKRANLQRWLVGDPG
jgi:hypothetical protein